MRTYFGLVALLAALTACGDSGGNDNQNTSQCPAGHEPSGPACVPIFDDCPGAAEIPVLGGGCQQVGVTACATGLFESDGAGGCEPILPDHACPPGTMEMLGQTGCQPVGVTQCAAGFESDGEGGCDAILPPGPDPCPSGTIALLGHTTCQPLGDCGTGTWGNIVDDGTTVYVDQTADATGADGSLLAPFVTISAALTAVAPGGQIAVAAGDYTERLAPGAPVRLTGRCAELVTIRGRIFVSTPRPPLTLLSSASGSTIRGVTLTGPGEGLLISGAQQVVLSQVQVRDASAIGINLDSDAEADLQRVVVAGCAETGILSSGSALRVEESVVRDTRPTRGTGRYGRGIEVMCSTSGVCGSLLVSASLVSGNRDVGILSSGHDSEVTASVVRDTLPEESSGAFGRGISAMCDSGSGGCGSLRVSSSVVSRNRGTGIIVFDVDTEVTGTVVRDTLADEITGGGGQGFYASCSTPGACVGLRISSSLVSGNRDTGIIVFGVNTEVTATVVRDTLARESTGEAGQGIWTQCSSAGVCGGLRVSSSLVSGNRDGGVVAFGVEVEVTDSVVRDTLPSQSARDLGQGIWAQCASTEVCGSLLVSSSVVSGNRTTGISMAGVDTEVTSTVVRDTLSEEATGTFGQGIWAQCFTDEVCGSLRVSSSLLSGNRDLGLHVFGVVAEITTTVVRDTQSDESEEEYGRGINAQCYAVGACGSLRVSSSLVSGNRDLGIYAGGVDTEITTTVVRDTLPATSTGESGRGINVQCSSNTGVCGSLSVSSSLVMNSENVGIYVSGVTATLEGVVVTDTQTNAQGEFQGKSGHGIAAVCSTLTGDCGDLSMTGCLVDSSHTTGVTREGGSGFIASSVVRSVRAQPLDDKYGYGLQIGGLEGQELPTFDVSNCEIRDAKLAGILFYAAQGTLSGSVVSGGENSVIMNEGSQPTILNNNDLSGTVTSEPTWANLFPSPAPAPALPKD